MDWPFALLFGLYMHYFISMTCVFQRRLASAAKKAIAKIPQKTVKNGDRVSCYCHVLLMYGNRHNWTLHFDTIFSDFDLQCRSLLYDKVETYTLIFFRGSQLLWMRLSMLVQSVEHYLESYTNLVWLINIQKRELDLHEFIIEIPLQLAGVWTYMKWFMSSLMCCLRPLYST